MSDKVVFHQKTLLEKIILLLYIIIVGKFVKFIIFERD